MIFCLSCSFVAGSRCYLCGLGVQTEPGDRGSTQTPLNPPSLLLSSSHPCLPHHTPPVHLFIFSSPPSHPLSVQMVDCGIISSLLACLYDALQHPAPITQVIIPHELLAEVEEEEKKKKPGWQCNALNVSHICACQSLLRKQKVRSNVHATATKLGDKQIAARNKLQKQFGDIICMTKHVSSTDRETSNEIQRATLQISPPNYLGTPSSNLLCRWNLKNKKKDRGSNMWPVVGS